MKNIKPLQAVASKGISEKVMLLNSKWYEQIIRRPWLFIGLISMCFNLGLSLTGFYNWTYDSWAHMFFASHYMHSWFNTWEPRWFGGFSVTSYPPLVTQILALGGFVFGLENAYALLSLIGMIMVPVAVYFFCSNFLSHRNAVWAGFLAIFLPSLYITNYDWGQLPSMLALVAALFTGYFLWRYLSQGNVRTALLAGLMTGITAACHHLTFICFIPIIVVITTFLFLANNKDKSQTTIKRLLVFGAIATPLAIIPIYPFWKFALESGVQTEIPHITRTNLFNNGMAFMEFVVAYYFLLLLIIPFTPYIILKDRKLIPLFLAAVFLFLLGLGGTTILPDHIFGPWANWLTYERFALWASLLFVPLAVQLLPFDRITFGESRSRSIISMILIISVLTMCLGSAFLGSEADRKTFLPSPPVVNVTTMAKFLDGLETGQQYRYITLGFGEAQMQKLNAISQAPCLDGTYYTARTLPILLSSGIASLDSSKYFDSQLKTLGAVLGDASRYSLKWVLVNDVDYDQILKDKGFLLKYSAQIVFDSQFTGVTIWEKDSIPAIVIQPKKEQNISSYVWGVAPLMLVLSFFILLFIDMKNGLCRKQTQGIDQ